jgi:GntR family transcriptional repressor for pyruvate dehydrogenase complex
LEGAVVRKTSGKTSAVERVVNELTNEIIQEEFHPGDRLPTEPELAKRYHVGRNSVREAIKQLQAFGVLYIKRADGTYITESYNNRMLDPMLYSLILHEHEWHDFVQLREVIDIGTLHVAIQNPDVVKIIPKLNDILNNMEMEMKKPQADLDIILEYDLQFHSCIAETIHNPQITTVNDYITRISVPSRRASIQKWLDDGKTDTFMSLHRQIVKVLHDRNAADIVKAVEAHYVYWR